MVDSPVINAEDIVSVANTDINCDSADPEIHPNGQNIVTVSYGGVPHSIDAGKTRLMPRYIAEHYRLHLVDHLLTKQNKQVNDPSRKELEKQVILETVEAFQPSTTQTENVTQEPVNEPIVPATTSTPPEKVNIEFAPVEGTPEVKPLPTRNELLEECKTLGIETGSHDTVPTLLEKIKAFSGV